MSAPTDVDRPAAAVRQNAIARSEVEGPVLEGGSMLRKLEKGSDLQDSRKLSTATAPTESGLSREASVCLAACALSFKTAH